MRSPLVLAAVVLAGAAAAADSPNPAIGRLNHAGYRSVRHCTMFAVAPRAVVTAAHCIGGIPAKEFRILFGYRRMEFLARTVPLSAEALPGDIAVLCLGEDAPATLPVGREPGAEVTAAGYGIPAQHLLQETACPVVAEDGRQMLVGCTLAQGASGAPLINAAGEVVAVASMSGPGGSVATRLPADIAARCPG